MLGDPQLAGCLMCEESKLVQLVLIQIGHRPIFHFALRPMKKIVSPASDKLGSAIAIFWRGSDEEIDWVFVSLIDKRNGRLASEIIEPAADQRKAFLR